MTRFFVETQLQTHSSVSLSTAASHHARVRRMSAGEPVTLIDGCGHVASGMIERMSKADVVVVVGGIETVPPESPLELFVPVGDRDRMLWLAEKATELGVTAWRPVMFARSHSVSPRGEGAAFAAKVRARMIGALEQSGGAWLPSVHPASGVDTVARDATIPARFLLQAGAGRLDPTRAAGGAALILGPEGGMTPEEHDALSAGGWQPAALAVATLRFETAAVAGLAIIRASRLPASRDDGDQS